MDLRIVPKFNAKQIQQIIGNRMLQVEQALIMRLQKIGEEFVVNARENGSYTDQTGNLRNSIGYVILKDGVQLHANFRKSAKIEKTITRGKNKGKTKITSGSKDGVEKAKSVVEVVKEKFPKGLVLIVVAGMHYAAAVEAIGKDVLTASSKIAEQDLIKAMSTVQEKMGRMK